MEKDPSVHKKFDDANPPTKSTDNTIKQINKQPFTNFFGDEPVEMRCPYCNANTVTEVKFQNGIFTYILALAIVFIFGSKLILSLIVAPLVFFFTKQLTHTCSLCLNQIGTNGKLLHYFSFNDSIISLKIGEVGFIVTRKLMLNVCIIFFFVFSVYYRANQSLIGGMKYDHSHLDDKVEYIQVSWRDYLEECRIEKIVQNEMLYRQCSEKFLDKTPQNWTGYVIKVEDQRYSLQQFYHHAISVLVKMDPSENEQYPDIYLTFDSEQTDIYQQIVEQLQRGQKIGFNGTFKFIGSEMKSRHMHGVKIWIEEGKIEIPPHIHQGGRYQDTSRSLRRDKSKVETNKNQQNNDNQTDKTLTNQQQAEKLPPQNRL